jgi:hypothetical protein
MGNIEFGPEVIDLLLYAGDTSKISFKILNPDNAVYSTTGSWQFKIYNKQNSSLVDVTPTGISISPTTNETVVSPAQTANGITEVTISNLLSTELLSTASAVYEFSLVHNGRNDRFTFAKGDISVESKLSD